jgi:hypothetical protein
LPPGFAPCRVCKDAITNATLGVCPLCRERDPERAGQEEMLARKELLAARGVRM